MNKILEKKKENQASARASGGTVIKGTTNANRNYLRRMYI